MCYGGYQDKEGYGIIAWHENLGNGNFSPIKSIYYGDYIIISVFSIDLDGDGDNDVLSAFSYMVAWYENLGNGNFGPQQLIASCGTGNSVFSIDLDGDGDNDVLSASAYIVAWYENLGNGNFGPQQVIVDSFYASSVYSIDLDGDGDNDVLSTGGYGVYGGKIVWNENLLITSVTEISNTDIKIYPNPTQNIINVSYNKEFLPKIYDITGRKLLTSNSTTTDISQLSKGIYIILLKDEQGVLLEMEKLIVE